jgi:hypothetical protein
MRQVIAILSGGGRYAPLPAPYVHVAGPEHPPLLHALSDIVQDAQRGFAAIKENQKAKIKRQKSLRRAAGRIGEEFSGAGRNQNNRQRLNRQ